MIDGSDAVSDRESGTPGESSLFASRPRFGKPGGRRLVIRSGRPLRGRMRRGTASVRRDVALADLAVRFGHLVSHAGPPGSLLGAVIQLTDGIHPSASHH